MFEAAPAPATTVVRWNHIHPQPKSYSQTSLPPTQSGLSSWTNTPFSNYSPRPPFPPSTSNLQPLLQPSFRPAEIPFRVPFAAISPPFTPTPTYQTPSPGVPPPGVNCTMPVTIPPVPDPRSGALSQVPFASAQQLVPPPYSLASHHARCPLPMQSTYASAPQLYRSGFVRYSSPYEPMIRAAFPPRPMIGFIPRPRSQVAVYGRRNLSSEQRSGSRYRGSGTSVTKHDKNEDEKTAYYGRAEISSSERSRRHEYGRYHDRDPRRNKKRELERYEKEREQERAKMEKDREYRNREIENRYKLREKVSETREREKLQGLKREQGKEKDRHEERKHDSDDGYAKRRKYGTSDEERKRRQQVKDKDLADRMREEEEDVEMKLRAEEELNKRRQEVLKTVSGERANGNESNEPYCEDDQAFYQIFDLLPRQGICEGEEGVLQNGKSDESVNAASDEQLNSNAPTRKWGFGVSRLWKRVAVPCVFNEDEDEDEQNEKKMKPLVPIDYSTEEHQTVQSLMPEGPSANMVAATDCLKHGSTLNPKEEELDLEKEKDRCYHEKSCHSDRGRHEERINNAGEEGREDNMDRERVNKLMSLESPKLFDAKQLIETIPRTKKEEELDLEYEKERSCHSDRGRHEERINHAHEEGRKDNMDGEKVNKLKSLESSKLFDAKQLIETIPRTKNELFSYEINWVIYKQNALHERMRPWISKKIANLLGEEEEEKVSLVDYIVASTQEHISADDMLERLQDILDEEAEMFVLKMWRMLIFEIKKAETGLADGS